MTTHRTILKEILDVTASFSEVQITEVQKFQNFSGIHIHWIRIK